MYQILQSAHSGLRWLVLLGIVIVILSAAMGLMQRKPFNPAHRKLSVAAMVIVHLQFLLGIVLFFISPKVQFSGDVMSNDVLRFFTVEHTVMMLIAVVLVTIGNAKAKRGATDRAKFRNLLWYFLIALILILVSIPWPFREGLGGSWF